MSAIADSELLAADDNIDNDLLASIYNDNDIKNDLETILSDKKTPSNKIPMVNNKANIEATVLLEEMDRNDITNLQNAIQQTDQKDREKSTLGDINNCSSLIRSNSLYDKLTKLQCELQQDPHGALTTKEQERKQTITRLQKYVHLIQSHVRTSSNDSNANIQHPQYILRTEPIPNPCVTMDNLNDKASSKISDRSRSRSFGTIFRKKKQTIPTNKFSKSFDKLLDNKNMKNKHQFTPKRLKYELPNYDGDMYDMFNTYELYEWLKPNKLLGEGAFGTVYEVIDERSGKKYAVKKNKDIFINISDAIRALREIKLMIHFNHPNIMGLCGVVPPKRRNRYTYKHCYLIMHKMDTTLANVIRSKQQLSERHKQYFIYQIARGLEYMHSGGIIHRDLKPENVLVNLRECKIKIIDFGLARSVGDVFTREKLTEYVVTRWYRAPEVMCCSQLYNYPIDIWSLGCIASELYTRRPIFKGGNHYEQLDLIFDIMGTPKDLEWITSVSAKEWIAHMPCKSPKDLNKILPNSTKLAQDFISELLIVNPNKRANISSVIKHGWLKSFVKDKHYKKCPTFNNSFEKETSIKTLFGVRHMMYEELRNFYELCVQKHDQKFRYQQMPKKREYKQKTLENIKISHNNYFS